MSYSAYNLSWPTHQDIGMVETNFSPTADSLAFTKRAHKNIFGRTMSAKKFQQRSRRVAWIGVEVETDVHVGRRTGCLF